MEPLHLFSDYCFGLKLIMLHRRIWYWINKKIPQLTFFFILFACLHDILLMLLGEILSRSYVEIQWLTSLPVQVSFELPDPMFCIQY